MFSSVSSFFFVILNKVCFGNEYFRLHLLISKCQNKSQLFVQYIMMSGKLNKNKALRNIYVFVYYSVLFISIVTVTIIQPKTAHWSIVKWMKRMCNKSKGIKFSLRSIWVVSPWSIQQTSKLIPLKCFCQLRSLFTFSNSIYTSLFVTKRN